MDLDIIMDGTGLLQFNDSQRTENCVWVATAHLLKFDTVSAMESALQLSAPAGGSSWDQQQNFRIRLNEYFDQVYKKNVVWTLLHNTLPFTSDCVVCFTRPDGTGHCVNREGGQFKDYQMSDVGADATADVQNSTIKFSWFFELARF